MAMCERAMLPAPLPGPAACARSQRAPAVAAIVPDRRAALSSLSIPTLSRVSRPGRTGPDRFQEG